MRIITLDLSTKSTGYAIFNNTELEKYGCITASSTDVIERINKIITELEQVIAKANIEKVILEEVRPEQGKNLQTYRVLMYLQAAVNFLIHERFPKVKIEYMYPSSWRAACGIKTGPRIHREELKQSDIAFVKNTYGLNTNDDEADAIGIGHAYLKENQKEEEINWE